MTLANCLAQAVPAGPSAVRALGSSCSPGTVLADASDELVGTAQAIAAGAVLAVISIAVIPHAFAKVSTTVAIATALGFVVSYVLS